MEKTELLIDQSHAIHSQIQKTVTAAFHWIVKNKPFFSFFSTESLTHLHIKATTELGLLCALGLRYNIVGTEKAFQTCAKELLLQLEDPCCTSLLIESQPLVMGYALFEELSQLLGIPNQDRLKLIQKMIEMRYVLGIERVPFRKYDLAYSLGRIGVDTGWDMQRLYRQTVLSKGIFLPMLTIDDTYAVTHTVFYLTDMGHGWPSWISEEEKDRLRAYNRQLTRLYLRIPNDDILGELLVCQHQMEDPINEDSLRAWKRIIENQDSSGYIAGPGDWAQHLATKQEDEKAYYIWSNNYHTTLVVVIAGLLWLREFNLSADFSWS